METQVLLFWIWSSGLGFRVWGFGFEGQAFKIEIWSEPSESVHLRHSLNSCPGKCKATTIDVKISCYLHDVFSC